MWTTLLIVSAADATCTNFGSMKVYGDSMPKYTNKDKISMIPLFKTQQI